MTLDTTCGASMSPEMLQAYFRNLVNLFFKILPIRESGERTLGTYMESLQFELLGCNGLVDAVHNDPLLLSLVSILQYLIDHPDSSVAVVKREVFRAISICNKLKAKYAVTFSEVIE